VDPYPVRIVSVCSGGGGLDLGVARALTRLAYGHRTILYVEREAYAVAVLAARMADGRLDAAPIWTDLETLDGASLRGSVDLVVAGIPCQGNSSAGKRRGVDDERWLWPTLRDLLDAAGRPALFLENVRNLVAVNGGAAFRGILGDLAARGYDAEWRVVAATDVGAPHRRKRLFILAWQRGGMADAQYPRFLVGGAAYDDDGHHAPGHDANGCDEAMAESFPPAPDDAAGWVRFLDADPRFEPSICRMPNGVAYRTFSGAIPICVCNRIDRLRLLGNGVVPAQAESAFLNLMAASKHGG
jgi:DNA (cytosine-5)-methyltransferase 1